MAEYPSAIPTIIPPRRFTDGNAKQVIEDLSPEVVALATELGTNPRGSAASVKARIDALHTLAPVPTPRTSCTVVTAFQSGHGWTADGTHGSVELNDTTTYLFGSQSARVTTNGTGGVSRLSKASLSLNATAKAFRIWMRVDDATRSQGMTFYAGTSGWTNYYRWDAHALSSPSSPDTFWTDGRWAAYTLSFADAVVTGSPNRASITDLRIAWVDDNTSHPFTYWVNRIDLIPDTTSTWPNGVVSFSFDDNWSSQLTAARKLAQYGYPATSYSIVEAVGSGASYLSLSELRTMHDYMGWEVAGHANTFTAHNNRLTSLSQTDLDLELLAMKEWLLRNGFRGSDHFAYPGGAFSATVEDSVKKLFGSARTTYTRVRETAPPADPYKIRTRMLASGYTLATAQGEVDKAYTHKAWLIFSGHKIGASADSLTWTTSDFNSLVDYVASKGIAVATVGEVMAKGYI